MQPRTPQSIFEQLSQSMKRDPKRAGLLLGLVAIMIVLWGRVLLNGPASATASLIRKSVSLISDPLPQSVRTPTDNPVMDWLSQPKRLPQRNLFAMKLDYYARAGDQAALPGADDGSSSSAGDQPDQARQQQILQENLQSQAAKLKLQTTMMGSTPRAMVNGELVQEGDVVEGFTIVKIEPRQIVVRQDGAELNIAMP